MAKAKICITYKDNTKELVEENEFYGILFEDRIENKNGEFVKIGDMFIKRSEVKSYKVMEYEEEK